MKQLPVNFELIKYGLHVRLVREEDAAYIVKLRTNPKLGQFVHATSDDVSAQENWIREYRKREKEGMEFYFIFSKEGENVGVVRLYNIEDSKFTSGSWLASSNAIGAGVLCDIISREIAFKLYPDSLNFFCISKENTNVMRYALSYHPIQYDEDEKNLYFYTDRLHFEKYKQLYLRMARL